MKSIKLIHLKTVTIVIIFTINSLNSFSQEVTNHWESIITPNDSIKYFEGNITPDVTWKDMGFNDNSWLNGKFAIGYGDNDDSTIINEVISVYIRNKFTITDRTKITQGVLHVDYDDAFVAYLNGVEIARSNIGIPGTEPGYNQVATSNHEAKMYAGGLPESFNISLDLLNSFLVDGENILSIQTHNVANSSDMSCIVYLSVGISDESNDYKNIPTWFKEPVPLTDELTSSNLPIIYINTDGGASIVDDPKVGAQMNILYNPDGNRNYITDAFHKTSGRIAIEIRGNNTQGFPKKAFTFETRDSIGENRNQKLLGLPVENDWVLRATYIDKTLMRNAIASHISRKMGRYTSRYAFCEVFINGSYQGVYTLMEKLKWDAARLNIDKLYPWTTDDDSITGGYLFEVAQSGTDFGERRRYKYPNAEEINSVQSEYIRNYDDTFRATMNTNGYDNPLSGYPILIDVNSFIDEVIIQEALKNSDAYGWSSYFHKDRLRKLSAGPVWDFDQALSNSMFNSGNKTDEWLINKGHTDVPSFWPKLFNEANFSYLFKKRWFELRDDELNTDSIFKFIDNTALYLDEGQKRNFTKWPILGVQLYRSLSGWDQRDTYQKEVAYMKTFLSDHLDWIDIELSKVPERSYIIPNLTISEIMYNPIDGAESEFIEVTNTGEDEELLTGIFFSNGITYTFPKDSMLKQGET